MPISPKRLFMICGALFVSFVLSFSVAGEEPEDRFGMSEESYERFVREAERFGMTPQQLKRMIDSELGRPLLYDRERKFVVSWQSDANGSPTAIHIAPDPTGSESVGVKYELGHDRGPSAFTYSGAARPEAIADVIWRDLNADGVFDQVLVTTDHNQLLKLDRGAYILIDGQWAPAVREEGGADTRMRRRDTNAAYRLDFQSGRWIEE